MAKYKSGLVAPEVSPRIDAGELAVKVMKDLTLAKIYCEMVGIAFADHHCK
jgi:hypothetical protein